MWSHRSTADIKRAYEIRLSNQFTTRCYFRMLKITIEDRNDWWKACNLRRMAKISEKIGLYVCKIRNVSCWRTYNSFVATNQKCMTMQLSCSGHSGDWLEFWSYQRTSVQIRNNFQKCFSRRPSIFCCLFYRRYVAHVIRWNLCDLFENSDLEYCSNKGSIKKNTLFSLWHFKCSV